MLQRNWKNQKRGPRRQQLNSYVSIKINYYTVGVHGYLGKLIDLPSHIRLQWAYITKGRRVLDLVDLFVRLSLYFHSKSKPRVGAFVHGNVGTVYSLAMVLDKKVKNRHCHILFSLTTDVFSFSFFCSTNLAYVPAWRESTEGESEHDFPYPHILVQVVNKFPKVFLCSYVHLLHRL